MVGAGLNVFAVWNYIITKTHFGVIELNPKLLKAILGGDLEEIESAIHFLSQPDVESRSKEEEGRRIVREGQFQYRVVNWQEYQRIKNEDDLREYNRVKQAERRARIRSRKDKPLPGETRYLEDERKNGREVADANFDKRQSVT